MSQSNPYTPPKAQVADIEQPSLTDHVQLNRVAAGQRLVVMALLLSLAAIGMGAFSGGAALAMNMTGALIAVVGIVRLASALGSSGVARILYAVLMLVPLLNLLVMLRLSSRATKVLRAGGYKVGIFGASQK